MTESDQYELSFDCTPELYELVEFEANRNDETLPEYVEQAVWFRIHMESRDHRQTLETDIELPEEFARWARLYTNAQNAPESGSDDPTSLHDVIVNHATWEYNYYLDGEPLEVADPDDCDESDDDG
jgi:hypothetical protein